MFKTRLEHIGLSNLALIKSGWQDSGSESRLGEMKENQGKLERESTAGL